MFWDNQGRDVQSEQRQRDVSMSEALGFGGLCLVPIISTQMPKLQRFYFEHYEQIYFALAVVVIAVVGLIRWKFLKWTSKLEGKVRRMRHVWSSSSGIYAGQAADGTPVYVSENARTGHVQIIGSTGRGKTESVILPWLLRDMQQGRSAVVLDGKGDPGIVKRIEEAARAMHGPPEIVVFDLGNLEGSCVTNPLQGGTAQQITDRIFTAFEFEDPFYRGVQYTHCGLLVSLIREVDAVDGVPGVVTFAKLHSLLTDDGLLGKMVAKSKNADLSLKLRKYLTQSPAQREQNMMGIVSQIAPFATGEVAQIVNGAVEGRRFESLSDVVLDDARPRVFVILLPTLSYQKLGHQLGKLFLQELAWAVGQRASRRGEEAPFMPVFLDEFSAFVYQGFESILNKARSSQVALHLSHQSTGDLAVVSSDLATIINTNTNVKCLLGLNDPDTADFFARHMGTETEEKLTEKAENRNLFNVQRKTGDLSIREVESYIVHPNRLKNFTRGRGVIHLPTPDGNVTEEIQFVRFNFNREIRVAPGERPI